MSDEDIDVKFGAQTGELDDGVEHAKDSLGEIGGASEGLIGTLGELAAAFASAFAVDKLEEFSKEMSGLGTQLEAMSAKTGLSTDNIEQFQDTVKILGGDSESAGMALQRLERNISAAASNAEGPAADAFHRLGVSQQDLAKGDVNQVLSDMATRMSDTADGANKLGAMMTVAGRGGAVLIPVLDQGQAGLAAMKAAADSTGPSVAGMAQKFDQSHQGIEEMELSAEKLGAQIYSVLEPALDAVTVGLKTMFAGIADNISEGTSWTGILQFIGAAIDGVTAAVKAVIASIEILADIGTGTFKSLMDEVVGFGRALADVAHGNVAGAWDDIKKAQTTALADMSKGFSDAGNVATEYTNSLMKMMDAYQGVGKAAVGSGVGGGSTGKGQIAPPKPPKSAEEANQVEDSSKQREIYASNYETKKTYDDLMVASGKMSRAQEIADLQAALTQEQQLTDASFDADAAQYDKDSDEYNKLMSEKTLADNKFQQEHNKLSQESAALDGKVWQQFSDTFSKNMGSMFTGVMQGTQTMDQAFGRMCGNMIISFVEAITQMIAKWVAFQALTSAGVPGLSNPFSGGIGALIGFATGADNVPHDMVAQIHKGEMIVPADQAEAVRSGAGTIGGGYGGSTANGTQQQSGGDTHVHYHVNAMDSGDVQGFFSKHGPTIAKTVSSQLRAGNLKPVGAH